MSKNASILNSVEGSELPVNLDDLPNFKIKTLTKDIFAGDYNSDPQGGAQIQVAVKFITELERLIQAQDTEGLLVLYDAQFNKLCSTVFKDATWPQPYEIEIEIKKDLDSDIQALYIELCYRHALARRQTSFDSELVTNSWENYTSIFDSVIHAQSEFPLPVPWIWDIIDEYIYQFYFACRWRRSVQEDDQGLKSILEKDPRDLTFWNLENIMETFETIVQRSQIIEKGTLVIKEASTTSQFFGFFSLVGQLRVNVLIGNYEAAIKSIENIDFESLLVFSKAVPAYLNLFYYSGFAYLMTGRYREAVKQFEAICLMMNKYKSFLTKSFQSDNMQKQLEKAVCLLAVSLVFYPNKQSENTFWAFKEMQMKMKPGSNQRERVGEKYEKLMKYDQAAFQDLFNFGCPKLIQPIASIEDFKHINIRSAPDLMKAQREIILKDFQQVQLLNGLAGVMKLYSKISVTKAAQMLSVTKDDFLNLIKTHEKRESAELLKTAFEQTVLARFFAPTPSLKFEVAGENVTVSEVAPVKNFTEQYTKLNKKMVDLSVEIFNLL